MATGKRDPDPEPPPASDSPPPAEPAANQVTRSSGHQVIRSSPRPWTVGERVRLRKAHPCGSSDWRITGTGADIRLACLGCGRRVELPREEFNRRVKQSPDGPPGR